MRLYPARRRTAHLGIRNYNSKIKWLKLVGIVLLTAIIESSFLNNFRVFGVKPNLSILIVLYFSLFLDLKEALILNALLGLVKDSLSGTLFGLNLFLFIIYTSIIWFLRKQFYKEDFSIQFGIVCITVFINSIVFASFQKLFLSIIFLETIYTICLMPVVFKILKKCELK